MQSLKCLSSGSWNMARLFNRLIPLLGIILYFVSLSSAGFGILMTLHPRSGGFSPRNIDMFFTSVSASTVSSMSTLEMEVFSNGQLVVMTLLMLSGGEVFTSLLELHFNRRWSIEGRGRVESAEGSSTSSKRHRIMKLDQMELSVEDSGFSPNSTSPSLRYRSIKFLGYVVSGYFVGIHVVGVGCLLLYMALVSSARNVLRNKGLKASTFAVFTVVSTFSNCGFVPTNENMMVFCKNSGLLLLLIPQILLGNTLLPPALRLVIWVLGKKFNKVEAHYLLHNTREAGYGHLLPHLHSVLLAATVFGCVLISFLLFCSLEWDSSSLNGLNGYQKAVGVFFQCTNARHTGETIVDLSTTAPAILVFFVVMMYLPPYTTYIPVKSDEESAPESGGRKKTVAESLIFSQLGCLVIFIILICITERKSLKEDPLNFSILNIVVEVISAYGNVGFTTGYSCERQIKVDPKCVTKWYGFSGKWSDEGKIVLIIVMFFGRMKKFSRNGGRAWKLL